MSSTETDQKNAIAMSEKLREMFKTLDANARANLLSNFEKAMLSGQPIPGSELVIEELKNSLRGKKAIRTKRQYDPKRLYFEPLAPFLINEVTTEKSSGMMRRASIVPLWTWLSRDVLPDEFHAYEKAVIPLLIAGEMDQAALQAYELYDKTVSGIKDVMASAQKTPNGMQRFLSQLGGPKVMEDLTVLLDVLENREILHSLKKRLGDDKITFSAENKQQLLYYIETVRKKAQKAVPFAFVLLKAALDQPSHILKVMVASAETDSALKLASHPFACTIEILLTDMERAHKRATHHLRRMEYEPSIAAMKDFQSTVRGLHTEVDLSESSNPWHKRIAQMRTEMGRTVTREIELLPMDIRKCLSMSDKQYRATEEDLTVLEGELELLDAAKLCANEMAINELIARLSGDVKRLIETGANNLLEQYKNCKGEDELLAHQLNCAIRIAGKVFGSNYAQLMQKGMELAQNDPYRYKAS